MQGWLRVRPKILEKGELDHRIPPLIAVVEIELIKGHLFKSPQGYTESYMRLFNLIAKIIEG